MYTLFRQGIIDDFCSRILSFSQMLINSFKFGEKSILRFRLISKSLCRAKLNYTFRIVTFINDAAVIEILILLREGLDNHKCYPLSTLHGK